MTHRVEKRHKKLRIVHVETGEAVYTPPDFLRVDNRDQLQRLADRLTAGENRIEAVMAFETERPRRIVR